MGGTTTTIRTKRLHTGTLRPTIISATAISAPTRQAIGWGPARQATEAPAPEAAPLPLPERKAKPRLRLTRRGRIVRMVVLIVLAWLGLGLLATGSRASDPAGPLPVVVVEEGDTLWTVAARHRPSQDPFGMIQEIRDLNDLRGYTIHPGQELQLPRGR